ncbi:MarR family winged helix-turn-helix transcriptional regulator [Actinomycetospora endophytica]|uniref:MarR family winged helix-turn-helix transcriptional regulator n=1 Tax=Actinomycetospora endophytica TaxID=2291215 RepID=A0ABS8P2J3_9PSEU|nr:MarR family winged helix-turn-helix transcriptional regulator [Actinomycetospora endophytica]MCD2191780.1 MarR family winged helix-turn-helix transcriptional regulator [Actinomycetospora endophytica]
MGEHGEFARAVRDLVLAGERFRAQAGRRRGLSPSSVTVLTALFLDGPRGPSELAGLLDITTASATELIDRLQALDHVVRRPHPRDRRRLLVELTESGAREIEEIFASFAARVEASSDPMSPAERDATLEFVRAVRRNLGEDGTRTGDCAE